MSVPLLTSIDCTHHVHLIIGDNNIAAKRVTRSLEAGASCVLITPTIAEELHFDLKIAVEKGEVKYVQREFEEGDLRVFGREEVDGVVDMVFITLSPLDKRSKAIKRRLMSVTWISGLCKRLRIPINCTDSPTNCTFSLLSTHRDGPLQIGVSTSGKVPPFLQLTSGL